MEAGAWDGAEVQRELRIGLSDGDPQYLFGRIRSVAAGHDGSIFVAEHGPAIVRMYDANGRYVREIGREGQGPGEYGDTVQEIRVLPDGTLALWDIRNARMNLYEPNGDFRDSFRVEARLHSSQLLHFDLEGNVYVKDGLQGLEQLQLRAHAPDGTPRGTIPFPPEEAVGGGFVLGSTQGSMYNFPIETISTWSPLGYVVTGRNDRYSIELRDGDDVHARIERGHDPVSFIQEEREQWQAWTEHIRTVRPSLSVPVRAPDLSETPDVPEYKPVFKGLYVGDEGRIWVHKYVRAERIEPRRPPDPEDERPRLSWREPVVFDVFEPDGTFLGEVVLPRNTVVMVWRGDTMWGIETGDDDQLYVVRLRVHVPDPALDPR